MDPQITREKFDGLVSISFTGVNEPVYFVVTVSTKHFEVY